MYVYVRAGDEKDDYRTIYTIDRCSVTKTNRTWIVTVFSELALLMHWIEMQT